MFASSRCFIHNFVILISLIGFAGCDACRETIERKTSIDNGLEIYTKTKDCGATTSFASEFSIVNKGQDLSYFNEPFLVVEKYENLSVRWIDKKKVLVEYDKARIKKFTNEWYQIENGNIQNDVEIILKRNNI